MGCLAGGDNQFRYQDQGVHKKSRKKIKLDSFLLFKQPIKFLVVLYLTKEVNVSLDQHN